MKRFLTCWVIVLCLAAISRANNCEYWFAKVDPSIEEIDSRVDETNEESTIAGIACFLTLEGKKSNGVLYGAKSFVSQRVPRASIEINALYYISKLFYRGDDFASAVALVGDPVKVCGKYESILFNSNRDVRRAFKSYRKWFKKVKTVGLEEARKQKLDPLDGSGVRWY